MKPYKVAELFVTFNIKSLPFERNKSNLKYIRDFKSKILKI